MGTRKRVLPEFLTDRVSFDVYERWLARKAAAHVKRDRKRGHATAAAAAYRDAIHEAVVASGGRDRYTGEELAWNLISTYNNEDSEAGRHHYKAQFALLPTVDHVEASSKAAAFCICAWRTNDAKNDLSHEAFLDLCVKVLTHAGYAVSSQKA